MGYPALIAKQKWLDYGVPALQKTPTPIFFSRELKLIIPQHLTAQQ
jgi:hypothetical protein